MADLRTGIDGEAVQTVPGTPPVSPGRAQLVTQHVARFLDRSSATVLRVSLGVVFVWFGALKLTTATPVRELVANTVPFLPADLFVPALGVFEVLLGVGLLVGRWLPAVVALMVMHLGGTFLVLITQPEIAFQGGNPLELTMTGEFVVKNIVLITAGLVVAARARAPRTGDVGLDR